MPAFLRHLTWKPQILEEKMNTMAAHPKNQGKSYLQTILSYFLILALCCFYLLVYGPVEASATEYFIDHVNGNDNNSGSKTEPWRTLANVNGTGPISPQFIGGDKIYLKRGQKWNDRVTVNNLKAALAIRRSGSYNGSEINYITIADFVYETDDPNLPKPIINGNGLDCAIYLDQDFIQIKNLDITINKDILIPILSLLLLDSSDEDTSESTISSTSLSLTLPPTSLESPPPAPTPKRSYLPPPSRIIPALPLSYVDPPAILPVLPSNSPTPEVPEGFFLTPEGELIPIPATTSALTSDPFLDVPPEEETAAATGVKGKGIRIEPGENNYTVENNIVIESCDVHDFAASGISIGSNRGYITIKGEIVGDSSSCNIYNNGQNGIEVFILPEDEGEAVNVNNKIDGCSIYNNTWNGIYLRGDQATIANNLIYSNGNELAPYPNPTHNIYLWGDNGVVYSNSIRTSGEGGNGCGFRYSGSNLRFGMDSNDVPYGNDVIDNYNAGVGLWNNDPTHNCDNNKIANNIFNVKKTGVSGNNMAISIGYDPSTPIFTNTYIYENTITGDNDPEKKAGGIDIQPCQNLYIHDNTFSGYLIADHLTGPLIQIDRQDWTIPDLNDNFSHDNTFYVNSPGLGTGNLWFYDEWFNDNPGWCSWDHWTLPPAQGGLGRDANYHLIQGQCE